MSFLKILVFKLKYLLSRRISVLQYYVAWIHDKHLFGVKIYARQINF